MQAAGPTAEEQVASDDGLVRNNDLLVVLCHTKTMEQLAHIPEAERFVERKTFVQQTWVKLQKTQYLGNTLVHDLARFCMDEHTAKVWQ